MTNHAVAKKIIRIYRHGSVSSLKQEIRDWRKKRAQNFTNIRDAGISVYESWRRDYLKISDMEELIEHLNMQDESEGHWNEINAQLGF